MNATLEKELEKYRQIDEKRQMLDEQNRAVYFRERREKQEIQDRKEELLRKLSIFG